MSLSEYPRRTAASAAGVRAAAAIVQLVGHHRRRFRRDGVLRPEHDRRDEFHAEVEEQLLRRRELQSRGVDHALEAGHAIGKHPTDCPVAFFLDGPAVLLVHRGRVAHVGDERRRDIGNLQFGRGDQRREADEQLVERRHARLVGRGDHERRPAARCCVSALELADQVDQFGVRRVVVDEDDVEVGRPGDAALKIAAGPEHLDVVAEPAQEHARRRPSGLAGIGEERRPLRIRPARRGRPQRRGEGYRRSGPRTSGGTGTGERSRAFAAANCTCGSG